MGDAIAKLFVEIGADIAAFKSGVADIKTDLQGVSDSIASHSKQFKIAGFAMLGTATAIGGAGLKMAADYEGAMREVNTMLNYSETEFQALQDQVLQTAQDVGKAPEEMARGLYQVISAGVPAGEALDFLATSAKAAIGGVTSTATAVDGITTVLNAFHMEASQADSVASTMFTTVKRGKTTFEELSASLYNVAPIGAAAGASFEEIAGSIASLTKQGVPTAQATTQIRAAFQAILAPTEDMTAQLGTLATQLEGTAAASDPLYTAWVEQKAALTDTVAAGEALQSELDNLNMKQKGSTERAKELKEALAENAATASTQTEELSLAAAGLGKLAIQTLGLQPTLDALSASTGGNTKELQKLFGSVEAISAVLALTGDNAAIFTEDVNAMTTASEEATAATEAHNQMNEGAARQYEDLMGQVQAIAITIGQALMPALLAIFEALKPILESIGKWISDNPELTAIIIAFVGVLGTLLVALGFAPAVITAVTTAATGLGAAIGLLTSPIGLVIAAIAALIAIGYLLWDNWDAIANFFGTVWDKIVEFVKKGASAVWDFLKEWGTKIIKIVFPVLLVADAITEWKDEILNALGAVWDALVTSFKAPINGIIGLVNQALGFFSGRHLFSIEIPSWVPGIGGKGFSLDLPTLPSIPTLSLGANIDTGGAAIVGERGRELVDLPSGARVTPLEKLGNMGAPLAITIEAGVFMGSEEEAESFAYLMRDKIEAINRRDGL